MAGRSWEASAWVGLPNRNIPLRRVQAGVAQREIPNDLEMPGLRQELRSFVGRLPQSERAHSRLATSAAPRRAAEEGAADGGRLAPWPHLAVL